MNQIPATFIGTNKHPLFPLRLKNYMYIINFHALLSDDTVVPLKGNYDDIKIYTVYNNFAFPVVRVTLNLTQEIYKLINEDFDKVKFRMNVSIIETDEITADNKLEDRAMPEAYITNAILVPTDFDRTKYRDEQEVEDSGFTDARQFKMELELFLREHVELIKQPINGNYSECTMDDLLLHIFNSTGINKKMKILINKPNNNNELEQVILPSKNIIQTIKYLQTTYGVYRTGLRISFDLLRGYCLAGDLKYNEIEVEDTNEFGTVICYIGKTTTDQFGSYEDTTINAHYMLMPNLDAFQFNDVSSKELFGENIVIRSVSQSSKERIHSTFQENLSYIENSKESGTNSIDGTKKTKYYYNNFDNPYLEEATLAEKKRNNLIFTTIVRNMDLRVFTMNKVFYFSFLDSNYSEYNGVYQLQGIVTDYIKKAPNIFESASVVTFCKLPDGKDINEESGENNVL